MFMDIKPILSIVLIAIIIFSGCTSTSTPSGYSQDSNPTKYHTYISGGEIHWQFADRQGNKIQWSLPIETYRNYVTMEKNLQILRLKCQTCPTSPIAITDYRSFVQPEFFEKVIDTLTAGRTDKEFVEEVFNLKRQLIVYGVTNETAQWSAETLTEGRGSCRDTAVLMGSLLTAGNNQARYGMTIEFIYLDANNIENPKNVNHIILYVKFKDGTNRLIETTAKENVDIYKGVRGWSFDITKIDTCNDRTIFGQCSGLNVGLYCDNGNLIRKCQLCGCPTDYPYCRSDGSCFRYR